MTVEQFRANPDLVKEMRQILASPVLKMFFEAMNEEAPVKFPPADDVSPHFAHIQLGQQTGWAQFEKILLSGGQQPPTPQTEPVQSYLNPEDPPEE